MNFISPQTNPTLNSDILPNIIKYLPLNDAGRFRAVCHAWRDSIDDYFRSIKVLHLRGRPQIETSASWAFRDLTLMKRSMGLDNIRTIHFNQILLRPTFSPNQQFAVILAKLFPNATELYFLDWDYWKERNESFPDMFQELFSTLTGVKKLAIQADITDQIMDSITQNLESLNTLIFFWPSQFPVGAIPFLKKLKRFSVHDSGLRIPMLGSSPNLEAVSFRLSEDILENTMNQLTEDNFPKLKHVSLYLADTWLLEIGQHFSYLNVLRRLLSSNPGLSSLELYTDHPNCELDLPHAFATIAILAQFRALKSLTITVSLRCRHFLEMLAKEIKKFRSLETLCLQTQYYVDTEMVLGRFLPNLPKEIPQELAGNPPKIVIENIGSSSDSLIKDKLSKAQYAFPIEAKPMGFFLNV